MLFSIEDPKEGYMQSLLRTYYMIGSDSPEPLNRPLGRANRSGGRWLVPEPEPAGAPAIASTPPQSSCTPVDLLHSLRPARLRRQLIRWTLQLL